MMQTAALISEDMAGSDSASEKLQKDYYSRTRIPWLTVRTAIEQGYIYPGWRFIDYLRATDKGNPNLGLHCSCGRDFYKQDTFDNHLSENDAHESQVRKPFEYVDVWGVQGASKSSFVYQRMAILYGDWQTALDRMLLEKDMLIGAYEEVPDPNQRIPAGCLDDLNTIISKQEWFVDKDFYILFHKFLNTIRTKFGALFSTLPNVGFTPEMLGDVVTFEVIIYPNSTYKVERYCFSPDALVNTSRGFVPIRDVQVGDLVLSCGGSFERVSQLHVRSYVGDMVRLRLRTLGLPLLVTPNHSILTNRGFISAGELIPNNSVTWSSKNGHRGGDLVAIPLPNIPNPSPIDTAKEVPITVRSSHDGLLLFQRQKKPISEAIAVTSSFARLAGYYVGDGGITWQKSVSGLDTGHRLTFTFTREQKDYAEDALALLKECLGLEGQISEFDSTGNDTTLRVQASSKSASLLVGRLFGFGTRNKVLPSYFYGLDMESVDQLLAGWMRADGCKSTMRGKTVSRSLALQLYILAVKAGYEPRLHLEHPLPTTCAYVLSFERSLRGEELANSAFGMDALGKTRHMRNHHIGLGYSLPVWKTEIIPYSGLVYNLAVEGSHTYTSNLFGVHNCWDIDPWEPIKAKFTKIVVEQDKFSIYDTPAEWWKKYQEKRLEVANKLFTEMKDYMTSGGKKGDQIRKKVENAFNKGFKDANVMDTIREWKDRTHSKLGQGEAQELLRIYRNNVKKYGGLNVE